MSIARILLLAAVLTGAAWTVWIHLDMESQPAPPVTEFALRSYSIALAKLGLQESPFMSAGHFQDLQRRSTTRP